MCRMTSEAVRKSMQGNKRCDTKPELLVRARLRAAGLTGYRLQWKVPGHPDVAWPGKRVALFINGCFWHRCPRCQPRVPKTNVEYWVLKFERNVARDERTHAQLEEMGWRVHVVWECELKKKTIDDTMARLLPQLADELGKRLVVPDEPVEQTAVRGADEEAEPIEAHDEDGESEPIAARVADGEAEADGASEDAAANAVSEARRTRGVSPDSPTSSVA